MEKKASKQASKRQDHDGGDAPLSSRHETIEDEPLLRLRSGGSDAFPIEDRVILGG